MYRVGDFSIISRVSIKMLRHYDEINLFKPAQVDPFTNYRYYTLDQLPRLNRIMALKSMGFTLADIQTLLDQPLSLDELRAKAAVQRAALLRELKTVQDKVAHLDSWMRRIEMENTMPEYEIVLKPISGQPPLPLPSENMITQPLFTTAGLDTDVLLDREQMPLADALACAVHVGDPNDLVQAYRALDVWIREHNYQIAGTPQEIILEENALHSVIEVQIPILIAS
jgi:DNA-binding transcriptional MerR regulator